MDINTNSKTGPMWMMRGRQAHVSTPGVNHTRYLAGSPNWRTGMLIATEGPPRNSPEPPAPFWGVPTVTEL